MYDCCLRAVGRKPYLVRLQGRVHKAVTVLEYFTCRSWQFNSGNVTSLHNALSPEDAKEFDFDIASLDWQQYMHLYVKGYEKRGNTKCRLYVNSYEYEIFFSDKKGSNFDCHHTDLRT